jgi:hypothetical protein
LNFFDGRDSKSSRARASIKAMSKTEYTLLAIIIGFYTLLFAYLLTRALAGVIHALRPVAPKIEGASRRPAATARNRAWTRAVWREHLAPDMERRKKIGDPRRLNASSL